MTGAGGMFMLLLPPREGAALLRQVCFSEELWRWGRIVFFATDPDILLRELARKCALKDCFC